MSDASELAFLRWFWRVSFWGPVGDDFRAKFCARWVAETGKPVPKAFRPIGYIRGGWGDAARWLPTWGTHPGERIEPTDVVPEPDRI